MRRAAALAITIAVLIWVQRRAPAATDAGSLTLALGFTLLGASLTGDALRRLRLPRLTGYLLFGVIAGPYLGNVITQPMAEQLQFVSGIATAFIALIAGLSRQGLTRAQIEAVRVAKDRRGTGIGEALLRHAIETARREGCGLVQLTTDRRREAAHRFYEKLGFVPSHLGMKLEIAPDPLQKSKSA